MKHDEDGTPHLAYLIRADEVSFTWSGNMNHSIQASVGGSVSASFDAHDLDFDACVKAVRMHPDQLWAVELFGEMCRTWWGTHREEMRAEYRAVLDQRLRGDVHA